MKLINNLKVVGKLNPTTKLRLYSQTNLNPSPTLVQLKEDMKLAMRNKEKLKLNVIKSILSEITYAEKSSSKGFVDPEALTVQTLHKAMKRRVDSIENYLKGNRKDLADVESLELEVVKTYLPEPMSEQQILLEVKNKVAELQVTGIKQLGILLKGLQLDPAQAPKAKVATVAKKYLEGLN